MSFSCPFCHISLPSSDLEWHVDNHIANDELERDFELAQQIANAPASPRLSDEHMNYVDAFSGTTAESSFSSFTNSSDNYKEISDQEKVACLIGLQTKSVFYRVEGGLMALLRRCLESETEKFHTVITGNIDHYQSVQSEDAGWGCGWRNIQTLSSHLLMESQEEKHAIFGGSGFVPDIPSLQRWLEIAWERGFDIPGSSSFDHKIYGCKKWIGATECAALFHSFGLRARIVDFDSVSSDQQMANAIGDGAKQLSNGQARDKRMKKQVFGPMDKFLHQVKHDDLQIESSLCELQTHDFINLKHNNSAVDHDISNKFKGKSSSQHVLVDWIWSYFTSEFSGRVDDFQHVVISKKTPLYFQHDGHSRTVVGIQMRKGLHGLQNPYSLLVLDPAQRTADLERSLRYNSGWQKQIKRGVHTLKKSQYQLCYVDPGIARGEEIKQLKTIDSILIKF